MTYKGEGGEIHLLLQENEDARFVLRMLVKTSFFLALPRGLSVLDLKPLHLLSDEEADKFITAPRSYDGLVVDMDFVEGRECKTAIFKHDELHYVLDQKLYERFRGSPEIMLKIVKTAAARALKA